MIPECLSWNLTATLPILQAQNKNYKLHINTNKTEGMQSSDYRFQSNSDDRYFTTFTVVDTLSGLGAWTRWSPFPTLKSSIHTTRSFKLHAKDHQWRASSKSSTPHRHWRTLVAWQGTNPKTKRHWEWHRASREKLPVVSAIWIKRHTARLNISHRFLGWIQFSGTIDGCLGDEIEMGMIVMK